MRNRQDQIEEPNAMYSTLDEQILRHVPEQIHYKAGPCLESVKLLDLERIDAKDRAFHFLNRAIAMSNWLTGELHDVTADMMTLPWSGHRDGRNFRCGLCGHRFAPGDQFSFNLAPAGCYGNFLTCGDCHGDDAIDRRKELVEEWEGQIENRFWWAIRQAKINSECEGYSMGQRQLTEEL